MKYSIPFFVLSFILIILFGNLLKELGQFVSGLVGIGLGVISLLLGFLIDDKVNR